MRHLLIGKGNLGLDLHDAFMYRDHTVAITSRSDGFRWPDYLEDILNFNPTHVWVTAGAGSVAEAKTQLSHMLDTHVTLPVQLALRLPKDVHLGVFSTDYVASQWKLNDPRAITSKPLSLYAVTKLSMEYALQHLNRPRSTIFRVGSLYGRHFMERCLPIKILRNKPKALPTNTIIPTPTEWVADTIASNLDAGCFWADGLSKHHVAPSGTPISVADFGRLLIGDWVQDGPLDKDRPQYSELGCTLGRKAEHWLSLLLTSEWLRDERKQTPGAVDPALDEALLARVRSDDRVVPLLDYALEGLHPSYGINSVEG